MLPRPTASIVLAPAFSHLSQTAQAPSTELVNGVNTHVFTFFSAYVGAISTSLTANVEVEVGEVVFTSNVGNVNTELRLASVPNGGSSTIAGLNWEILGTNRANLTALTYGPNSSNSALGYEGYSFVPLSVTLPVKFLSFYALKTGDDAKLNWTVENDEDNASFDIERSTDGRSYTRFATVKAFENGKSVNTYNGNDSRLSGLNAKTIYYRIKQLDKSGTAIYSPIRTLNVGSTGSASLFPNPARSITKLVVDAPSNGKGSIVLRDATGKQAMMVNTNFVKGINQLDLNVSALASGEYNVTIIGEGLTQTLKMSKIN
ncbi:MAG: T9SS C-terminal target domain-containing protein [Bacteroidetes bacterium]|nr:MAG: T9SS C-terminal target domain-containing protein [Bacteroidota bacterium]